MRNYFAQFTDEEVGREGLSSLPRIHKYVMEPRCKPSALAASVPTVGSVCFLFLFQGTREGAVIHDGCFAELEV